MVYKSSKEALTSLAMTTSEPKRKTRAADLLFAHFEAMIRDGRLAPGETLPPEREIVDEHGVSRTVVREAVLALANKGLIKAEPRYRPVVLKPGYDTAIDVVGSVVGQLLRQADGVRNLFDLRIMMEVSLARDAALSASADDIRKLEDALLKNEAAIPDSTLFYETDIAFHGVLYDMPGNPLLRAVHTAYTDWLSVHWQKMPRDQERNKTNHAFHEKIFQAILRRDADQAEAAVRKHLDFAWSQVGKMLEDGKEASG